ncbi:MAG: hypothetical protein UY18_C0048G0008 [Microgenomates group bacterium GW2011_GWF2_47_9]|nr:MAG: hypothetical protein UY18_C0048G0008 [Microgenomates group bacterium GW2011_GWF2_47_9]
MHGIFLAVLIMACTAHFSVAVEIPQPWNVVIESPDFLNASPEKQKQIRQQWEKDYRENEAVNTVMMDLWNKHPELHTDTNEYFGFMARRDNYLHQGKPMSEALKLRKREHLMERLRKLSLLINLFKKHQNRMRPIRSIKYRIENI